MGASTRPPRRRWPWIVLFALAVMGLGLGIVYWRLTRPTGYESFEAQARLRADAILRQRERALDDAAGDASRKSLARASNRASRSEPTGAFSADTKVWFPDLDSPPWWGPFEGLTFRLQGDGRVAPEASATETASRLIAAGPCACGAQSLGPEPAVAIAIGRQWLQALAAPGELPPFVPDPLGPRTLRPGEEGWADSFRYGAQVLSYGMGAAVVRRAVLQGKQAEAAELLQGATNLFLATRPGSESALGAGIGWPLGDGYHSLLVWLGRHPGVGDDTLQRIQEKLVQARRSPEEMEAGRVIRVLTEREHLDLLLADPDHVGPRAEVARPGNTYHYFLDGSVERLVTAVLRPIAQRSLESAARAVVERRPQDQERALRRLETVARLSNVSFPRMRAGSSYVITDEHQDARQEAPLRNNLDLDVALFLLGCTRYQLLHGAPPHQVEDLVPDLLPRDWWNAVSSYGDFRIVDIPARRAVPLACVDDRWRSVIDQYISATGTMPHDVDDLASLLPPGTDVDDLAAQFRDYEARTVLWISPRPEAGGAPGPPLMYGEFEGPCSAELDAKLMAISE